jgi:hypothetical protein
MMEKKLRMTRSRWILAFFLVYASMAHAQGDDLQKNSAGYVPVISGGIGYVHNINGGITTLEPQINPVLLLPLGHHVLVESRTSFSGSFQREFQTHGPFTGKVFKSVDYAQADWLLNTHITATAGKYLLPFGLYNERLSPLWIRNLQDSPITSGIGTRTSGAGDGVMLRGMAIEHPSWTIQYSAYFSALSNVNQLQAARTAGGDVSIFLPQRRLEIGTSYQRFLQGKEINSEAVYASWQPHAAPLDLKVEFDQSYYGRGYWIEPAYMLSQVPKGQKFFQHLQVVARMEQFYLVHSGGSSIPGVDTQKFSFGMNYYLRDDTRLLASYGRQFSSQGNANVWNFGFTHRFLWPLWPGRKK